MGDLIDDERVAFNGEGVRGASGRVGSRVRLMSVKGCDRCVGILGFTSKAPNFLEIVPEEGSGYGCIGCYGAVVVGKCCGFFESLAMGEGVEGSM